MLSSASIHPLPQCPILMPVSLRPPSLKAWSSPIGQLKQVWASTTHYVSPSAVTLFYNCSCAECMTEGDDLKFWHHTLAEVLTAHLKALRLNTGCVHFFVEHFDTFMVLIQHLDQLYKSDTNTSNFYNIVPLKPHFRNGSYYVFSWYKCQ